MFTATGESCTQPQFRRAERSVCYWFWYSPVWHRTRRAPGARFFCVWEAFVWMHTRAGLWNNKHQWWQSSPPSVNRAPAPGDSPPGNSGGCVVWNVARIAALKKPQCVLNKIELSRWRTVWNILKAFNVYIDGWRPIRMLWSTSRVFCPQNHNTKAFCV